MEEAPVNEKEIESSRPPSLREPYTWLVITDGANRERQTFYSITEDYYYVRFIPELKNKNVVCCYKGLLVLKDRCTDDCSLLNILTMEVVQLPPLHDLSHYHYCVISSSKMDRSCRVIFFEPADEKRFRSCYLGDSDYTEGDWSHIVGDSDGAFLKAINSAGKLYTFECLTFSLFSCDLSDANLLRTEVIVGGSIRKLLSTSWVYCAYLVDSCGEILLVFVNTMENEISDVKIFKADFSSRTWVGMESIGDRVIFLDTPYMEQSSAFSSPASAFGLKGNVIYCVSIHGRHIYTYDLEDKSISASLPCPIVKSWASSLFWVSCLSDETDHMKPPTRKQNLRKTIVKTELGKICKREYQVRTEEEEEYCESSVVGKKSSFADFPSDLLRQIYSWLHGGDRIVFRCVCTSWYSVLPLPAQHLGSPPAKLDRFSSPYLLFPNKIFHPIYGDYHHLNYPDMLGSTVRYARDGWLLMTQGSQDFFFFNPFTKEKLILPPVEYLCSCYSIHFSAPPTSTDCLVVAATRNHHYYDKTIICSLKAGDDSWTYDYFLDMDCFNFSSCNLVVYKGLYYFLGQYWRLLIYDPIRHKFRFHEAPRFISDWCPCKEQYLLESDGKLLAVLVGNDGNSVHVCQWKVPKRKWETLTSLGNRMLFVSRPYSLSVTATIRGTGNKVYFPRFVGDNILFYSMSTKKYHTFDIGSTYRNIHKSKHHIGATWICPP